MEDTFLRHSGRGLPQEAAAEGGTSGSPRRGKGASGERPAPQRNFSGLREEELDRILHLKRNLDYSDTLIQYAGKYRKMGWELVAVNLRGEPAYDLDFREAEEAWAARLADWSLEGYQVNLGIRTGAPSRLLVVEVHREESRPPFDRRGEWGSGCVAEVGLQREQHYYTLPKGWQPPSSFFLEGFQIMIFGEGGLVLAPPSMEPQLQTNLRWLRPPWESPPTRPSPALCRFISDHAPRLQAEQARPLPEVMAWSRIYPLIQPHPRILQALLAPATSFEAYYRTLLMEARAVGLEDPAVLMGLLWHAPLGDTRDSWEKAAHLEELVKQSLSGVEPLSPDNPPGPGPQAGSPAATDPGAPLPGPPEAAPYAGMVPSPPGGNGHARPEPGGPLPPTWQEMLRLTQENLLVERRRYEAMIYELGKLGALQEFFRRENRQNKALRDKLESQWTAELEYLRQQLTAKKPKKGWYRSWWQE
ncbi:MAG: bifunctional DNA primase/polymerase [Syntrophobacterales bacterium]|nr:bifunctional DNA primase/polymerase [Syntrophobacterales bacterium]